MTRAAIVSPVRTGIGTFGGSLKDVSVEDLGTAVVQAVLERTEIAPHAIDDVLFAQSYANSETPCIGRWLALNAGLPIDIPGLQIDRRCGGGLQAIVTAAMMVETGAADVVLAGGVESMSRIEYYSTDMRWGARAGTVKLHDRLDRGRERAQPEARFGRISGLIETAENLARDFAISREEADEFAVNSHKKAAAAWAQGKFEDETIALSVPQRRADPVSFRCDEGIRADTSVAALGRLNPIIHGGTVTAANSSQQNDAAAACLVVAEDKLDQLGLEPMAYLRGWTAVGCDPSRMGIGPVRAVEKLFEKTKLGFDDMDLVELNEAFAAQALACLKSWAWNDPARLNVNGSGISLGHPIGATGARIMTTLLHELKRREGRYGLETMCVAGGQGMAAIFERAI
ncbi:acetyl-CoA C-acetyltransferase [Aminobacter aminovorans]|jgi:acetyl-CoA C-acetyltransferase|uniref:Beta-ketothiolase n=1 Tax=Aminobacter aminovorans TaxID=83263 RepID=A0AAC8YVQ6_AMIAI|nr:acetyl-CoA C-acetyltransferase [Aminobacter aminovorans]AMS45290.1 acetyl-CoA acetyltransferase [Aminobacter aminovorans]